MIDSEDEKYLLNPTNEYFAQMAGHAINKSERDTQNRIVALFQSMGYHYIGNLQDRDNNNNIEAEYLRKFLEKSGHSSEKINPVLTELINKANDPF